MEDLALAEELVERLNALIEDPEVLDLFNRFMKLSLLVPPSVVAHPTLQFAEEVEKTDSSFIFESSSLLRFLGILNGIVGVKEDGWGYIAAVFDDTDRLVEFQVLEELKVVE